MFQDLLKTAQENINTCRCILKTNEQLRKIIFSEGEISQETDQDAIKLINRIKQDIPKLDEWRIFEHCALVTRLYAIYEQFIEGLIRDWLAILPKIFSNYSDLEENIRTTHQMGVGKLLTKPKKDRYKRLSVEAVIRGLYYGATNEEEYELLPDAFLIHEQNLRKEILEKLFADAGIKNIWQWVNKHRCIEKFKRENQKTPEGELKKLIIYRNDAAHGGFIDNLLGFEELLELCEFVEALCQAITELVACRVIQRKKEIKQANKVGKITEWLQDKKVGILQPEIENINLSTESTVFLVGEAYCQLVKILSIKINDDSVKQIQTKRELEIGLQFNINGRKNLDLYLIL